MTWLSTSSRKIREAQQHGGVPNAPAIVKPNTSSSGFTWFFDAASLLKGKKKEASGVGDTSAGVDVLDDKATPDEELNDLILKSPGISGASLVNTMRSQGLQVSKTKEAWQRFIESAKKGIPTKKFDDCVADVKKKGNVDNAYAVCNWSLGRVYAERVKAIREKCQCEADSASAFPQVTVAGKKKESRKIMPTKINFRPSNLREADRDNLGEVDSGHKLFDVILIEEGMGNFGDAYYYHRDALESAIPLFEGLKIYADHPSKLEEETRPERSTRDILGHYEDLTVDGDKDEAAKLSGKVDILSTETWAVARMQRAIENAKKFPDKDFVGLSINASGDAEETPIDEVLKFAPAAARPKLIEAQKNGIDSVKVVRKLNSAISCDFVTEAGAGGKILNFIEGEKHDGKKRV